MYKKSLFLLFLSTLMFGIYLMISSKSWFSAWLGLEINLMSFLPILLLSPPPRPSDASLKYFLIQAVASLIILQSSFSSVLFMSPFILIILALSLKLGLAPLHFWLPYIAEKISWGMNMILLTLQKIGPFFLIYSFNFNSSKILYLMGILSALVGALGGLNELFLRKLMAYSSISHMGWILSAMLMKTYLWLFYLSMYMLISMTLMVLLKKYNILHLNQTMSKPQSIMPVSLMFLSLGGFPPLLGFLPKWSVITTSISFSPFLILILIMSSVITLFFYLRSGLMMLSLSAKDLKLNSLPASSTLESGILLINIFGAILYMLLWGSLTL